MICPTCHEEIRPRDGVVLEGGDTFHGRCYGSPRAAFVEPDRTGERLTILLTEFLHGRVAGAGTSADLHQQAEAVGRNLAQVILNRFHVTERK